MQSGVVVGVVEVPMGVHNELDWLFSEPAQGCLELRPRRGDESIADQLPVLALKHNDITARPGEHGDVLGQFLDFNRNVGQKRTERGQAIRGLGAGRLGIRRNGSAGQNSR